MFQYVFVHVDSFGYCWKHIHFSRWAAHKARKWWSKRQTTTDCSTKIREVTRTVPNPRIVGMTVQSIIHLAE